jgi:hypothetical protein
MLAAPSILTAEVGMPVTLEQHLRALQGDEARADFHRTLLEGGIFM